jgi:hypothetical protein
VARINVTIKKEADRAKVKHADVDVDEYTTFIGLMRAARCETQRGRALWEEKTTGYTRPANFDDFMPRHRFELLKKTAPFAFADVATKHKGVWYMVTPVVTGFNENRRRTIRKGRMPTMDELMSAPGRASKRPAARLPLAASAWRLALTPLKGGAVPVLVPSPVPVPLAASWLLGF